MMSLTAPERSVWIGHTEYMSATEYLQRRFGAVPKVPELGDEALLRLGQIAASKGRSRWHKLTPAKLYHPVHETVNGWPKYLWDEAWEAFEDRFLYELPPEPETPSPPYSTKLLDQLKDSLKARGQLLPVNRDPRWQGAYAMLTGTREDQNESPEQALVRRTSAAAALFAIEKEYQEEERQW
jgi:hypothetical protein